MLFISCGQPNNNQNKSEVITNTTLKTNETLKDKTIKFLWRENKYDETLKDTFNTISINEDFCKTITEPERAALGYVATFIGNECNWDGDYKNDRSNLKCKILTALNLGYQCSDKHLGFLRQMFKNDPKVLEELKSENCPTTPDGATIQNTFDEIVLTTKGNEILIFFKVSGMNLREAKSWSWTETDRFLINDGNLKLIKKEKSDVKQEKLEMGV